jgi:histidinol-phosphate phosphatase family protein
MSKEATINHLVIVAGGKGTRLAGVADDLPKVLVPVAGKPVLQHQLELAAASGITGVTIFAGHLADKITAFVGDGARFGLKAQVLVEDEPLGNAGAVLQALDRLPEQFFVVYGDVMLAVDLPAMAARHLERGADFTTFVHPNDHPADSDLIEAGGDGWVSAIHAYPHPDDRFFANVVNAALYVARREALRPFAGLGKRDFTKDVMGGLVASGARVLAYPSSEYIKDMGTPARLERVEKDYRSGKLDLGAAARPAPAVFLDRDGTLNVEKDFLASHEGLELIPGAGPALRALRQGGYRLVVLTNQPVIARGEASEADVAAIHRRLEWELGKDGAFLDAIYLCPHHPDGGFAGERAELKGPCDCRKPGTALFEQACRDHRLDPARSWMVGDRTADIELARRAGLKSILVQTGAAGGDGKYDAVPDHIAADVAAAAALILQAGAA